MECGEDVGRNSIDQEASLRSNVNVKRFGDAGKASVFDRARGGYMELDEDDYVSFFQYRINSRGVLLQEDQIFLFQPGNGNQLSVLVMNGGEVSLPHH